LRGHEIAEDLAELLERIVDLLDEADEKDDVPDVTVMPKAVALLGSSTKERPTDHDHGDHHHRNQARSCGWKKAFIRPARQRLC
jgi:hypothetical protein